MAVALVQKSAALTTAAAGASSITPTLPGGSTSGNTLVAMLVGDTSDSFSTPASWLDPIGAGASSVAFIKWLPNCGSGVTSQAFTNTLGAASGNMAAALFEFSGVNATSADLDEFVTPASGTSWSSTTAANMTANNELVLLAWRETYASATKDSFTATTAGITQDFAWNQATKLVGHASFEHKLDSGTASGSALTVTETLTTGTGSGRGVTIVTFKLASAAATPLPLHQSVPFYPRASRPG